LSTTGNRLSQFLLPLFGGFLAAATGAAGVLLVTAFALAGSGIAVRISLREHHDG
jgi:hypothetical protein